jgi:hypothetical protein
MKRNDDLWNAIHTGGIKTQNQVEQRYKAATGN